MNREDIIRMAREAGFKKAGDAYCGLAHELERLAALVAAAEREACAKVCHDASVPLPGELQSDAQWSALCLATAIRARGETK